MTGLFWISYAAAWVLLLALAGGLLVLFRMSARAYGMQAPRSVGDVGTMNGPPLDAKPAILELQRLDGAPVTVGLPSGAVQLIIFAKNTCPKCKTALRVLRSIASDYVGLEATVICGGNRAAIEQCAELVGSPIANAADFQWEGAKAWRVSDMPFGVVLDAEGFVRARGDPTSAAMLTALTRYAEHVRAAAGAAVDGEPNIEPSTNGR